jgi:hypothetical protein
MRLHCARLCDARIELGATPGQRRPIIWWRPSRAAGPGAQARHRACSECQGKTRKWRDLARTFTLWGARGETPANIRIDKCRDWQTLPIWILVPEHAEHPVARTLDAAHDVVVMSIVVRCVELAPAPRYIFSFCGLLMRAGPTWRLGASQRSGLSSVITA